MSMIIIDMRTFPVCLHHNNTKINDPSPKAHLQCLVVLLFWFFRLLLFEKKFCWTRSPARRIDSNSLESENFSNNRVEIYDIWLNQQAWIWWLRKKVPDGSEVSQYIWKKKRIFHFVVLQFSQYFFVFLFYSQPFPHTFFTQCWEKPRELNYSWRECRTRISIVKKFISISN